MRKTETFTQQFKKVKIDVPTWEDFKVEPALLVESREGTTDIPAPKLKAKRMRCTTSMYFRAQSAIRTLLMPSTHVELEKSQITKTEPFKATGQDLHRDCRFEKLQPKRSTLNTSLTGCIFRHV